MACLHRLGAGQSTAALPGHFRPRISQRSQSHRLSRCQDIELCFRSSYSPTIIAQHADCRFGGRSTSLWFGAGECLPNLSAGRGRSGDPLADEAGILTCREAAAVVATTGEQEIARLPAVQSKILVDGLTGLLGELEPDRMTGLFLGTVARSSSLENTSSTRIATTSQPRSLLSMARLNSARSRVRFSSWSFVRIDQT